MTHEKDTAILQQEMTDHATKAAGSAEEPTPSAGQGTTFSPPQKPTPKLHYHKMSRQTARESRFP